MKIDLRDPNHVFRFGCVILMLVILIMRILDG